MAHQFQRDEGNGPRPSTSGSALSYRTAGGTEFSTNDPWTARIVVTAASGIGIYVTKSLVSFFMENPQVVTNTAKLVFGAWGAEVTQLSTGSLIVDLNFESKEKFLKFKKDLEDGRVKRAMEKEFSKIGYDAELVLTLKEVESIEVSRESVTRETKKITFVNPKFEEEFHGVRRAEKESNQKAVKYKDGKPSDTQLLELSSCIAAKWERIGILLGLSVDQIEDIKVNRDEKPNSMLVEWRNVTDSLIPYKALYDALCHKTVRLDGVAKEFCLDEN